MDQRKKTARIAGWIYLFGVVTGLFSGIYITGKLLVRGDAAATAANILANPWLFNIHIINGLLSTLSLLFVALALYVLLKDVSSRWAAVMLVLVIIQIPIGVRQIMDQITAVQLVRGESYLSVIDKAQRDALAMMFLGLDTRAVAPLVFLWGAWLFPLAVLVYRSGFLPRFLGIWLLLNGIGYVVLSFTSVLMPDLTETLRTYLFPAFLGEVALMLWLVIAGAKSSTPVEATVLK